jgi:hypothetical protein
MSQPLLCRLGFHKWQNYGEQVEVFWKQPALTKGGVRWGKQHMQRDVDVKGVLETHGEIVYEGHECKRCGLKLKRIFVTDSDGTLSCIGWEPDTDKPSQ